MSALEQPVNRLAIRSAAIQTTPAIVWPALWFVAILTVPKTGLVGTVVEALSIMFALRRAYLAVFCNERYRFTTWRWGVPLASLVALGALIKVLA